MKRVSSIPTAIAAALLLMGAVNAIADHGDDNANNNQRRLRTRLTGGAIQGRIPEGSADFRSDTRRSRLNVEAENVNLAAGTMLQVSVQRGTTITHVGTITLSALGEGELELNSEDGDNVPDIQKGDMVTVAHGATTILAGAF